MDNYKKMANNLRKEVPENGYRDAYPDEILLAAPLEIAVALAVGSLWMGGMVNGTGFVGRANCSNLWPRSA